MVVVSSTYAHSKQGRICLKLMLSLAVFICYVVRVGNHVSSLCKVLFCFKNHQCAKQVSIRCFLVCILGLMYTKVFYIKFVYILFTLVDKSSDELFFG